MSGLSILHADTADDWRGGQAQVLALIEGLAARGHRQALAAPAAGPLARRAHALGLEVHPWRPAGDLDLPAAFRLAGAAHRFGPDVLHLHSARAHAVGWWAAWRERAACVVSRRVDFAVGRHPLSALKYRLPVDRFLCISEGVRAVLARAGLPARKLAVVRSGIRVAEVAARVAAARATGAGRALRAEWGIAAEAPLVGMVAALAPHKDHGTFLAAAELVLGERPDCRFVCAGEGPSAQAVHAERARRGLESAVVLPGFVADVPKVLAALDVFVLSSWLEGLGTSVLDAQAAGVPVVATAVGGVPEMIDSGVTGLLVPARDPRALARAVLATLDDPTAARERVARACDSVRAFDVSRTVEDTEAAYRTVLAERGRG